MNWSVFDDTERLPREGLRRAPHVFVVDDDAMHRRIVERLLRSEGIQVSTAADGEQLLTAAVTAPPDLAVVDAALPGVSGMEVCRQLKAAPQTWHMPVVLTVARFDESERIAAYECGADDLFAKPVDQHLLLVRIRNLLRMSALRYDMENTEAVIFTLAAAVEAKDKSTQGHLYRMSRFCEWLAEAERVPLDPRVVRAGAILHDIGKIGIPDSILLKPGPLDHDEFEIMKRHPIIGERICRKLRSADVICPMVRHHHERWDGTGYPDGLGHDEIPITARIVSIADSFDAMVADRCYRAGLPWQEAFEILTEHAGTQWDPRLVGQFVEILQDRRKIDEIRRTTGDASSDTGDASSDTVEAA